METNIDKSDVSDSEEMSKRSEECKIQATTTNNNNTKEQGSKKSNRKTQEGLLYGLNDVPPWYISVACGMQHYLLSIGGLIGYPLLIASKLCIADDHLGNLAKSKLISSCFMMTGICTLLQTTIGNRLPIMQGVSFLFIPPVFSLLSLPRNQCPIPLDANLTNSTITLYNDTDGTIVDGDELWQRRMREIQGSIIAASLVQIILGATGAIGYLMRFIGPLTLVPTISLIGLDLFDVIASNAEGHWGIALTTTFILIVFSQYLRNVKVPIPIYSKKKWRIKQTNIIQMFPVLITLCLTWLLCFVFTVTDVFPNTPDSSSYSARTDTRLDVLQNSPWFRISYPGQWGFPSITVVGFFGMLSAIIAGIMESIGDYYACAKMVKAPTPSARVINRGITMEGIGCIFAGLVGTGAGTSSFTNNIAMIGMTRVASRRVMQTSAIMMIVLSVFGKFGSVFVAIPTPIIGGLILVLFGWLTAVGLSNMQYADLNSSRNIFIIGFTLLTGLTVSNWMKQHPDAINTGVDELDQILSVLLRSALLVGGLLGVFLDNTLPGTDEERGIVAWKQASMGSSASSEFIDETAYDLPFSIHFSRKSFPWINIRFKKNKRNSNLPI